MKLVLVFGLIPFLTSFLLSAEKAGDPYSHMGHLVMYPSGYGLYDLYRREHLYRNTQGFAQKAGKQHDWNKMEILAIGHRIRHVINGKQVVDWSDPQPKLCQNGLVGLQLHSNNVPQEVQFLGLVLTETPGRNSGVFVGKVELACFIFRRQCADLYRSQFEMSASMPIEWSDCGQNQLAGV